VASVELRFADGEVVSGATSAGPAYRGRFAGRVRFVLLVSRNEGASYLTRLRAADGHVIAAVSEPFAPAPLLQPPLTFAVADDGVRVCLSIGRFGPDGADCDLPPLAPSASRILRQTTPAGTLVAGVVPGVQPGDR
jgi:hypothetical protein